MVSLMEKFYEQESQLDLLWLAYLSNQFGKETLEWHKKNTAGFSEHVAHKLALIRGEEAWNADGVKHG